MTNPSNTVPLRNIYETSHTLKLQDAGAIVRSHNGSATTITIPPYSDVPFEGGTIMGIAKVGAGDITVAAGAGVILQADSADITTQYSSKALVNVGYNQWQLG